MEISPVLDDDEGEYRVEARSEYGVSMCVASVVFDDEIPEISFIEDEDTAVLYAW